MSISPRFYEQRFPPNVFEGLSLYFLAKGNWRKSCYKNISEIGYRYVMYKKPTAGQMCPAEFCLFDRNTVCMMLMLPPPPLPPGIPLKNLACHQFDLLALVLFEPVV